MGEKGAEVAPAPVQAMSGADRDAAAAAAIASIFGNAVDAVAPTTPTAQPMGELGAELSAPLPEGLTPTLPTLPTASPSPAPSTPASLEGLKPTADTMTDDLFDPGSALRP